MERNLAIVAGVVLAAVTVAGTVFVVERGRSPVVTDVFANLPNGGAPRAQPAAQTYAVAGAAAMGAMTPGAPTAAPAVQFQPDENALRAYAAMNALGQKAEEARQAAAAPAQAPQQGAMAPTALDPIPGFTAAPPRPGGGGPTVAAPPATPVPQAAQQVAALETPWGRPGDASGTMRTFEIDIRELHDGRMWFDPYVLNLQLGEQIRIIIKNTGDFPHAFVIATPQEIQQYVAQVKEKPDYWRNESNWVWVMPTERGELVWQFTRAGSFEFADVAPGRRDAGLTGLINVR